MTARFYRVWTKASRANLAASVGLLLTRPTSPSGSAAAATPAQRGASTLDVYRIHASSNCLRSVASHRVAGEGATSVA